MSATQPIEVRDMAIIHVTFRNGFTESARLVRANPTPSAARVTFLADHIDFSLAMLHHHHESEDELLYPLLVARAPERAEMTERVDHEHAVIGEALDAAVTSCAAWRSSPSAETGEGLAVALDRINETCAPHLDHEEQEVVPLAAVTLTQEEWNAVGEHSRSRIPRDKMPIAFGMITEHLDDADATYMKGHLPAPVRLLYPLLIDRPWKKYAAHLRTDT
jgi:hemerythrin-like domain-containing protein